MLWGRVGPGDEIEIQIRCDAMRWEMGGLAGGSAIFSFLSARVGTVLRGWEGGSSGYGTRGVGVVWRCVWAVGCRVVAIGGPCLGAWGGWKDCRVPRLFILFFSVTAECRQMEVDDVKG